MEWDPETLNLVGGTGSAGWYLNGGMLVPWGSGGNPVWVTGDLVEGPAGYNTVDAGLYTWRRSSGMLQFTGDKQLASTMFGNGQGDWLLYYGSNPPYSKDSRGTKWTNRFALGFLRQWQIFTDETWSNIIFRDVTTGAEQPPISNPPEWVPLPDSSGFFYTRSLKYRGVYFTPPGGSRDWYACGYRAEYGGMCVWRPFTPGMPTWLLNVTEDRNPTIGVDWRNWLRVGSGADPGETTQHVYDLDLATLQFRQDNGPWHALVPASPIEPAYPPPEPVPAIGRFIRHGWFTFGASMGAKSNCAIALPAIGSVMPPGFKAYVRDASGKILYRYVAGSSDSDVDSLEAAIRQAKAEEPSVSVLAYWTYQAQQIRVPAGLTPSDALGVEGYQKKGESRSQLEARLRTNMLRHSRCWLIGQCYDSNANNEKDLEGVVAVYARVMHDLGEGSLGFSDGNRNMGYKDHPEVHDEWDTYYVGIAAAPNPNPNPDPNPNPNPDPNPIPPDPEDPAMTYGQKILFRKHDPAAGEQHSPSGDKIDPKAWIKGVVVKHGKDETYLDKGVDGERMLMYAVSATYPSGAGNWITWNDKGEIGGYQNDPNMGPGGAERVTFEGKFMLVRPGCGKDGSGVAEPYDFLRLL